MDDTEVVRPRLKWADLNKDRFKKSLKHEARIAKELGGKRLPRSGGCAWSSTDKTTAGGDLETTGYLIEHKRTVNESLSVKLEWLKKVSAGAARYMKCAALCITFETRYGNDDWVLIPLAEFRRLSGVKDC